MMEFKIIALGQLVLDIKVSEWDVNFLYDTNKLALQNML